MMRCAFILARTDQGYRDLEVSFGRPISNEGELARNAGVLLDELDDFLLFGSPIRIPRD
jgi:hypothetical protein